MVRGSLLVNVWVLLLRAVGFSPLCLGFRREDEGMRYWLGVDIACRAVHQASLADERGEFVWSGRRFRTSAKDLEALWAMLPAGVDPSAVTVVMEPTRNAWVPLAAWFRRQGAAVVMVPPERSADLRAYYAKHAKSDQADSRVLARIGLLHPEGLLTEQGIGPGDPMRRAVKLRSNLVKRRSQIMSRLDALLEIMGPAWIAALSSDMSKTALQFLAHYADPYQVKRLGRTRLARFVYRHSRGQWGPERADQLIAAASETLALWGDSLEYPDLAEDIAIEARLALQLTVEIKELDERIAVMLQHTDPKGIMQSIPGVGAIVGAQILGRLGNPDRFASLAGIRAYSGLIPKMNASGLNTQYGGPTKRGDACLREALFMAAEHARRSDPVLAAKYHRLMTQTGKHHNSALCHIAAILLTRIAACWRQSQQYQLRDNDGNSITIEEGRTIIKQHYTLTPQQRAAKRTNHQERAGEIRSHTVLRQPARSTKHTTATTESPRSF